MTKQSFIDLMRKTQTPLKNMVDMLPEGKEDWAPAEGFMTLGHVLKHLGENWCIIKMMMTNEWPFANMEEAAEVMKLENLPSCAPADAWPAMEKDLEDAVAHLTGEVSDDDFFNLEVSAPWGFKGKVWESVLEAVTHQLNHKMQLHLYMKLLGLPVNTETLYGG